MLHNSYRWNTRRSAARVASCSLHAPQSTTPTNFRPLPARGSGGGQGRMMSQNTDQSYITLRVRRRAEVAVDTLLLELESASGEALPEWTPPAVPSHLPPSAPA